MIRLLTFTNLYPSEEQPRHGIFVEQRLRRLVESGRLTASVVVPVPRATLGGRTQLRHAIRHGIHVSYVAFPAIKGITSWFHPELMAMAARRAVSDHVARFGPFDVIDAHYLYPDGVAAARLASWFHRPFVITARGSDVNVAARETLPGLRIRRAVRRCSALIAVSAALRRALIARGIAAGAIHVLPNGVDLELFRLLDRAAIRAALGWDGRVILSVGNLVPEKGHDLALAALVRLADARLVIVGAGPLLARLQELAVQLAVKDRVSWVAPMAQEDLVRYYNAADMSLLCSSREGMPNVLLESISCGTPVVATAVGGVPEIMTSNASGRLVRERDATAIADACAKLLAMPPDRAAVRRHAEQFGWADTVNRQVALLESIAEAGSA